MKEAREEGSKKAFDEGFLCITSVFCSKNEARAAAGGSSPMLGGGGAEKGCYYCLFKLVDQLIWARAATEYIAKMSCPAVYRRICPPSAQTLFTQWHVVC